ncbi:hypothetical protein BD410DRAFT_188404 [Rickenella mellea]|uniref:Secreted protein n=1 Tax=Rickenella mellea TaxID=50990 RepID=A0A4Y7Q5Z5_9AGAM|nr:hypothetical protein BD410DRAFT_188404 [Rickenella mellea]
MRSEIKLCLLLCFALALVVSYSSIRVRAAIILSCVIACSCNASLVELSRDRKLPKCRESCQYDVIGRYMRGSHYMISTSWAEARMFACNGEVRLCLLLSVTRQRLLPISIFR